MALKRVAREPSPAEVKAMRRAKELTELRARITATVDIIGGLAMKRALKLGVEEPWMLEQLLDQADQLRWSVEDLMRVHGWQLPAEKYAPPPAKWYTRAWRFFDRWMRRERS